MPSPRHLVLAVFITACITAVFVPSASAQFNGDLSGGTGTPPPTDGCLYTPPVTGGTPPGPLSLLGVFTQGVYRCATALGLAAYDHPIPASSRVVAGFTGRGMSHAAIRPRALGRSGR